ncbi:MAG TPA: phosphoribosylglycinamide formyltransferase [Longimicrobiales bacterium]
MRAVRVAVFASGGGTNLQAILDHLRGPAGAVARVALVVSDRADAGALDRARRAGVATRVIAVRDRPVDAVARETLEALAEARIELVALAGYLRLVPAEVVRVFRDRIVNIHPALLPAFGGAGMYGARVHRAVLEAGCRVSGATVHLVDEHYDRGPILVQWPVPVLPDDTPETLAARVLRVEHAIYPVAVEALARAVAGGEPVRAFRFPDATTFTLAAGDAPDARQVRRALGMD